MVSDWKLCPMTPHTEYYQYIYVHLRVWDSGDALIYTGLNQIIYDRDGYVDVVKGVL